MSELNDVIPSCTQVPIFCKDTLNIKNNVHNCPCLLSGLQLPRNFNRKAVQIIDNGWMDINKCCCFWPLECKKDLASRLGFVSDDIS